MNAAARPRRSRAVEKKARGSSFYPAMRLMPKAEREAMFAIYAFCRRWTTSPMTASARAPSGMQSWKLARRSRRALCAASRRRAAFLAEPVAHIGLRKEDFLTVIDGMDMDVAEDIVAPDLATLDLYCERVASAVGGLSIKVFGMDEGPGFELAHHLGRALQLTNILRDLDEDARHRPALSAARISGRGGHRSRSIPRRSSPIPRIDGVCRKVARWRISITTSAARVLATKPKGRIAHAAADGRGLFRNPARRWRSAGWAPPRHRVSLLEAQLLSHRAAPRPVRMNRHGLCDRRRARRPRRQPSRWRARGARVDADRRRAAGRRPLPLLFRSGARTR